MQIIVTDANTPQALGAIRELGRAGYDVTAVAPCEGDKRLPLGLNSKYASRTHTFPPSLTQSQYQDWLLDRIDAGKKAGVPVLLPTGAKTLRLVAKRKIEFKLACDFLVPEPEILAMSWDKRLLMKAASACDIPMPEQIAIPDGENVSGLAGHLEYPVVVKYWGGEKIGLPPKRRCTIAHSARELVKRYDNMYDVQSPVLLQRHVPGTGMGVSVVMDSKSRPVRVFVHERVRQYPATGGPGSLVKSVWRQDIAEAAVKLFRSVSWQGLANAEFVVDGGSFTLVDCNARLWGSYPLSAVCGGRLAEHYAMASLGEYLSEDIRCRYSTSKSVQYFAEDIRAAVSTSPAAVFGSISALMNKKVVGGVRDRQDKKPTGAYVRSFFEKYSPELF